MSAVVLAQNKPKLVVGIVVDQMRYDYLYRFEKHYGTGGFKRLLNEGHEFVNAHFNYVPTYTAPGHASIYTGTTPSVHGIIGNYWFDKKTEKKVYCTDDKSVKAVGINSSVEKMSPANCLASTFGDELKLSNNHQSMVIGISMKDRGAILPAGHFANAAYWFSNESGKMITSSYYMDSLPKYVIDFNNKKFAEMYLSQPWKTFLPIEKYTESIEDDNDFEKAFEGSSRPVFPHDIPKAFKLQQDYDLLREIPYGNTFLKDFAIEVVKNEKLGKRNFTDVLAISFSSTDYVGHRFGVSSKEIEDTYVRLDKDLEELLKFLDTEIGKGEYVVFLTADHGAAEVPAYLKSKKMNVGVLKDKDIARECNLYLKNLFGDSLVLNYINQQFYLNNNLIESKKYDVLKVKNAISQWMMKKEGVQFCIADEDLCKNAFQEQAKMMIQNGFNAKRSGDVIVNLEPGWMEYGKKGSTHGAPYSYDTRVPVLFFGKGVKKGRTYQRCYITDIAPSISVILNIAMPSGCSGNPLNKHFSLE